MIRRIDELPIGNGTIRDVGKGNGLGGKKEESKGNNGVGMFDNSINVLSKEVGTMSEEIKSLEKMFVSRDSTTTASIEQLFATLKTLSHNQTVLENKVDDALKNQLNTDVMVNSINARMNQLSSALSNLSKAVPPGSQGGVMNDSQSSTANSTGNQSRPHSVRRGPGRPRKDGSVGRAGDSSGGRIQVNPVKVSLPTGAVQVSKSKRYFIDPSASSESVSAVKTEAAGKKAVPAIPVKRKRGRPPKKRTVEAVILNHQNASNADEEQVLKTEEEEKSVDNKEEEQEEQNHELPSQESAPAVGSALISPSLSASPPSMSRSSSPSTPIPNLIPSAAVTAETTDIPENEPEEVAQIPAENPIITTRIIGPLARKRLLGAAADSDNITIEMSSSSVAPDNNTADNNNPDVSRQQRELDKRRDAREKMLVNMKYNDREKAKSFMESNKQLLKAMREEERRKRMTALINAPPSTTNVQVQQYGSSSAAATTPSTEFAFKTEELSQQHRKVGISSMLNNEGSALIQESEERLARKRSNENDDQDDYDDLDDDEYDDDDQQDRRLRKRRSSNFALSPSAPLLEKSPSSEKETGGANKRQEDQASLLLASPIELLCRDGFFYQRDHPKVPITTGSYLRFKFKSKEEELVGLSISQKDFVDSTRHERMNAHFLKPEIDVETEQAFTILSKTTLTEKYVNSLEYFLMEFRWENKLVGLGLKLRESKRTWQRRKALFTLFEFWRDQSREKRNFENYTILHAVKEMENYRIFINRSVSWFYNHITLLKMILYDLCDNVDTQWREWMFNKGEALPILGVNGVNEDNINEAIDNVLTLDFLDDGTENNQVKSSKVVPPKN
ncbi:hypothetical protein HG536_0E03060 [Torulaspora globosa]|uniref:Uncharacterized protein n=1 Tax=Torulaspora globosa TaxID=48254 RepID=A0A7G3ZIQ9_9SACH|nr:uncharacterized protein HG536_0E03060 [Torulaspora globosa]QLL33395.1 hypothetical protein HG536_0E03060 [Torulaspora globosa]